MSFFPEKPNSRRLTHPRIVSVSFLAGSMRIEFADGQIIETSLALHPRLLNGTDLERNRWRLIGSGSGVHWPDLDEDISAENVLHKKPSLEAETSFRRWLDRRAPRVETA